MYFVCMICGLDMGCLVFIAILDTGEGWAEWAAEESVHLMMNGNNT